ncbi:dephospho-CoA kinase [Myroides sp. LJL115]
MKTKIVGLTGGIGSGKTTVAKLFMDHGVPVYISDHRAKHIMESSTVATLVQEAFEQNVLDDNGKLDRQIIRNLVFEDTVLLEKLNNIVHPLVKEDFLKWVDSNKDQSFVLKESAILFEKQLHKDCDMVILVVAPEEVRIQRVMERDKVSSDNIRQIMNNQLEDVSKIPLSDYIIENVDMNLVKEQVKCIVSRIKNEDVSFL